MRVAHNDLDDRAGLRGYVQFNKYTHTHTHTHTHTQLLQTVVVVDVVFFTLTDRASTIPSNIPGTWLPIRYVVTKRYQGQRVTSW